LRDIYSLEEEARDKEIERLCGLHPHLRQYFEDRPPPPLFRPTAAYISEFRLKERRWRLQEIQRQCARHPHLRKWFTELEAECLKADGERAQSLLQERERAAAYESDRALYAGAAFAALGGGAAGLIASFVPVSIVAGIFGVFAGGWSRTPAIEYAAFGTEAGWFWFLWVLCGLAGAGVLLNAQLKGRWLEDNSREVVWLRIKSALIAIPSIIVTFALIYIHANTMHGIADGFPPNLPPAPH
jgi:hypothetical protein